MIIRIKNAILNADFALGEIASLIIGDKERTSGKCPLFRVCLRNHAGDSCVVTAYDAMTKTLTEYGAIYNSGLGFDALAVTTIE